MNLDQVLADNSSVVVPEGVMICRIFKFGWLKVDTRRLSMNCCPHSTAGTERLITDVADILGRAEMMADAVS